MTTITDTRPQLWVRRQQIQASLTLQRQARAGVCGCTRCHDEAEGRALDKLIARNVDLLAGISDQITDRS